MNIKILVSSDVCLPAGSLQHFYKVFTHFIMDYIWLNIIRLKTCVYATAPCRSTFTWFFAQILFNKEFNA